jgi:adenylate cyclase class 2
MAEEVEAKFYLQKPDDLRRRLEALDAELIEARVKELNLRFDTSGSELRRGGRVLRLRQDTRARLTYKDSAHEDTGALSRREIEFAVDDFQAAHELLEALGFQVALIYEKYRTTYKLEGTEIMLDEMPYGHFVEIEGAATRLRPTAERLELNWDASITVSYTGLFDRLRDRRQLQFRDLTFENFKDFQISPADLGVVAADQ